MAVSMNRTHSYYPNTFSTPLPVSMKREVYVTHDAWQNLQRLASPFDAHDVLQRSWDTAKSRHSVRIPRDNCYAFQIVTGSTRSAGARVVAVMCPNRNPGRQPWAITYLGYDTHNVLRSR